MGGEERLEAYSRLIVGVGLNLQAGQDVQVSCFVEHASLARALARTAYEAGARYVDVLSYPNEGWAEAVFGEPDVERLWDAVARAVRLDEPDPVDAWRRFWPSLKRRSGPVFEAASLESNVGCGPPRRTHHGRRPQSVHTPQGGSEASR